MSGSCSNKLFSSEIKGNTLMNYGIIYSFSIKENEIRRHDWTRMKAMDEMRAEILKFYHTGSWADHRHYAITQGFSTLIPINKAV